MQRRYRYGAHPRRATRRRRVIITLVTAIALAGAGGGYAAYANRPTGPFPREATKGLTFPLAYVRNLPAGYTVDETSFEQQDGDVLTFNIKSPNGKGIAVAEQARPNDLELSQKSEAAGSGITLPFENDFTTPLGDAKMNLWGERTVISIPTADTWVILNVSGIPPKEAQTVARSFYWLP